MAPVWAPRRGPAVGQAAALQVDPGFRLALRSGRLTFGDVAKDQGNFVVYAFQPFPVAGGLPGAGRAAPSSTASAGCCAAH